jgi:short-subunit dehydrogenase involved in D-alanine esterification of teichoic acids
LTDNDIRGKCGFFLYSEAKPLNLKFTVSEITIKMTESSYKCYSQDAKVILACRNREKAQRAADRIILQTSNTNVEVEVVDLASFKSIREFALRFKAKHRRLDILINNAGKLFLIIQL